MADISQRACDVLKKVDLILAEDTRQSSKLLAHLGVKTPMIALHEHNEEKMKAKDQALASNKEMALISDSGTPLISDPGFKIVGYLIKNQISIIPIPGACALTTALCASGIPTDSFSFFGFLPTVATKKNKFLQNLTDESKTMIFYESPKRVKNTIKTMFELFGADRLCCIARELTKVYEQIVTADLGEVLKQINEGGIVLKGEFVIIIQGINRKNSIDDLETIRILKILLADVSLKQAVDLTCKITNINKNKVYKLALKCI